MFFDTWWFFLVVFFCFCFMHKREKLDLGGRGNGENEMGWDGMSWDYLRGWKKLRNT